MISRIKTKSKSLKAIVILLLSSPVSNFYSSYFRKSTFVLHAGADQFTVSVLYLSKRGTLKLRAGDKAETSRKKVDLKKLALNDPIILFYPE